MNYFDELAEALKRVNESEVNALYIALLETRAKYGRVFVMGNGGSMATAIHFAADLTKSVDGFQAHALDNISLITAYANDTGYENVFIKQLEKFKYNNQDLIVCLSTSGKSRNIINLISSYTVCSELFLLTENPVYYGEVYNIHTPSPCIEITEDIHSIILHSMIKRLKDE